MAEWETIHVTTGDEKVSVKAELIAPDIAIHEAISGSGWKVTHVPTGLAMSRGRFWSEGRARAYAAKVVAAGVDLSFRSRDEMSSEAEAVLKRMSSEAHADHEYELNPVLRVKPEGE